MAYDKLSDLTKALETERRLCEAADAMIARSLGGFALQDFARQKTAVGAVTSADVTGVDVLNPVVQVVNKITIPGRLARDFGAVSVEPTIPIPSASTDLDAAGAWVTQGGAIPLARLQLTPAKLLPYKHALMFAWVKEVLRIADARARNLILRRVTRRLRRIEDAAFVSANAATAAMPAGILNGLTSAGSGSPSLLDDGLSALLAAVSDGEPQSPVFIADAATIGELASSSSTAFKDVGLVNGSILGAPQLLGPTNGKLILLDASQIAIWPGTLEQEDAESAACQMDDAPTNNAATGTATTVVSAFQTGAIITRVIRGVSWLRLRSDAVAFIEV